MQRPDPGEFDLPDPGWSEDRLRRMDRRRIALAFFGAILLHSSFALGFINFQSEPVAPPGEMIITIDLAPAIASASTEPIAGQSAESAPQEETPPEPEPIPEEKEEVVEQPAPEPEPVPPEPVEPEPEIAEQEKIEPPPPAEKAEVVLPKKQPKPKPKAKAKPKPKPKPPAQAQAASSANRQQSDVGGSGARASPSDIAKYVGRLRAALERAKRYPAAAGGASGIVSIRFTVNRSGQVTGYTLTRSSGNAALDAAARAMIQNANLPAIPDNLPNNSITVGVPVNFRTR